ncbi:MAG: S1 family peptidase [Anaerolineae bacterium]|jgi:hypothetical protein|nr:S1 family peptidase [Anaerolineae bacterium]
MAINGLMQHLLQIQTMVESQLLRKPNVVGVAVGLKETDGQWTDQMAIVALVQQKLPAGSLTNAERIPRQIEDLPTDVYEIGYVEALNALSPQGRFRPTIPSGVSMGHQSISAGTLGVPVKDRATGDKLLLSNNHVFANSNDANVGDSILQPGPMDGGNFPADIVARLERYVPLRYIEDAATPLPGDNGGTPTPTPNPSPTPSGCTAVAFNGLSMIANAMAKMAGSGQRLVNMTASAFSAEARAMSALSALGAVPDNVADAAVARPNDPSMFTDEIRHIGRITGTKAAQLGMGVRKTGRTTDFTQGMVTLLNATVTVAYTTSKGPRSARFTGQVITQPMSQGGDSGSLVVDSVENKAVGLLFAGSAQASIFTPIDTVLAALNVTF